MRAIWSFIANEFRLAKESEDIDGYKIANCFYNELPLEVRSNFDVYALDVVVMSDADEDEKLEKCSLDYKMEQH